MALYGVVRHISQRNDTASSVQGGQGRSIVSTRMYMWSRRVPSFRTRWIPKSDPHISPSLIDQEMKQASGSQAP